MKKWLSILLSLFIFVNLCYSQKFDFSTSFKFNYSTTSRLYPNYIKSNYSTFDNYYSIDGIYGFGGDIRTRIYSDRIYLGFSGEYVTGSVQNPSQIPNVQLTDGYKLYIFEVNGYLIIPLSSDKFKIYIGGGVNSSFGKRIKKILDISVENTHTPMNIGIQVLAGLEYFFLPKLSLRWEMKFRDPEVQTESNFNTNRIEYDQKFYSLSTLPFISKINIDGIVFDLSLAYYF